MAIRNNQFEKAIPDFNGFILMNYFDVKNEGVFKNAKIRNLS